MLKLYEFTTTSGFTNAAITNFCFRITYYNIRCSHDDELLARGLYNSVRNCNCKSADYKKTAQRCLI